MGSGFLFILIICLWGTCGFTEMNMVHCLEVMTLVVNAYISSRIAEACAYYLMKSNKTTIWWSACNKLSPVVFSSSLFVHNIWYTKYWNMVSICLYSTSINIYWSSHCNCFFGRNHWRKLLETMGALRMWLGNSSIAHGYGMKIPSVKINVQPWM